MFNVTANKFSPPYGDGTYYNTEHHWKMKFSPPYGDGTTMLSGLVGWV